MIAHGVPLAHRASAVVQGVDLPVDAAVHDCGRPPAWVAKFSHDKKIDSESTICKIGISLQLVPG